jgi:hypothetical protein
MVKWADKEAAVRALERGGKVDPTDLIEAARELGHPCHGDFTWDVDAAALERWRDQARAIIRRCHFDVTVEEVTTRAVMYVSEPSKDEPDMFLSLPKIRGVRRTSAVLAAEVTSLAGIAARCYGIALAKREIVGSDAVDTLRTIRNLSAGLAAELGK